MYLCSVRWELCVGMEVTYCVPHLGVFITLIVGLCLNRFTTRCALTLGHFSAYNRPSLSFLLLLSCLKKKARRIQKLSLLGLLKT